MKNFIKTIYDESTHDGFMFFINEEELLEISPFTYKENSLSPIETHAELGLKYHIITYRETEEGYPFDPDMFEAILGDPYHYGSHLIKLGFFGTICKKTKSSLKVVTEMFEDLVSSVNDREQWNQVL